jgi:hypothetical protein
VEELPLASLFPGRGQLNTGSNQRTAAGQEIGQLNTGSNQRTAAGQEIGQLNTGSNQRTAAGQEVIRGRQQDRK